MAPQKNHLRQTDKLFKEEKESVQYKMAKLKYLRTTIKFFPIIWSCQKEKI